MEYSVFEVTGEYEDGVQPSFSPGANYIATVEAGSLEEAYEIAKEEYGSPIAVE